VEAVHIADQYKVLDRIRGQTAIAQLLVSDVAPLPAGYVCDLGFGRVFHRS
jgi:hypothetical protein